MNTFLPTIDRIDATAEILAAWVHGAATPTERSRRFARITTDDNIEHGQVLTEAGVTDSRVTRVADDDSRVWRDLRSQLLHAVLGRVDAELLDRQLMRALAEKPLYDVRSRARCRHCGENIEAVTDHDDPVRLVWIVGDEDCDVAPNGHHAPPLV